jgi:hypothetical protein
MPTILVANLIFMQDNARMHTAKHIMKWLKKVGIKVME